MELAGQVFPVAPHANTPRVAPHVNTLRVVPPVTPVPQAPRLDPPNGPDIRTRSKNPKFRSVAQEAMLLCATVAQTKLYPKQLTSRRFPVEMINAILNEETGELMEYRHIMKNPKYC